jgi:calmodulin
MADFEEAFELFDKDGDGTISTGELKNLLRCFGKKATEDEVFSILERFNKTGENEIIEFNQFVEIMSNIMTEPEFDDEIKQVFLVFDRDEKGITDRQLMETMNKLL